MEKKSPGSDGGLNCITSSTQNSMNGTEKIGAVMNGGSPDSTTPKDSVQREEMGAPSPTTSDNQNSGGGSPNMYR